MELYDKIDKLKQSLDQEDIIIDIKKVQHKIKNNPEIMKKIQVKDNINTIREVKNYRHLENQVNYMILTINAKLKGIVKEGE